MYTWNGPQGCHGTSNVHHEEDCLRQQIGLKFKEETSRVLHLEYSSVKVLKLGQLGKSFKNTCEFFRFGAV